MVPYWLRRGKFSPAAGIEVLELRPRTDISSEMTSITHARPSLLAGPGTMSASRLTESTSTAIAADSVDFIFSYDVTPDLQRSTCSVTCWYCASCARTRCPCRTRSTSPRPVACATFWSSTAVMWQRDFNDLRAGATFVRHERTDEMHRFAGGQRIGGGPSSATIRASRGSPTGRDLDPAFFASGRAARNRPDRNAILVDRRPVGREPCTPSSMVSAMSRLWASSPATASNWDAVRRVSS